ncbi:hypothetical protein [Oceanobacillus jordanicus]|uniref:Uncharacterized protein n=1 Tax=Oceanobacillus jordanicus TaxID=2867266 RepID=A0AAW5B8X2_9BACI|nr:hypothetical protein [Oceanobacillus jordanicus]MCG3420003.1 hypothetical protein [Oceanobacillus jordanicus]
MERQQKNSNIKKAGQLSELSRMKIRTYPAFFAVFDIKTPFSEGKCEDSSGNSTSPKAPEEAIFAYEETEAVPTESAVFSVAVYKQ